jgi:2-polyprenyl-3-methyl-5-hydroxy-6-metoxy-1,4-benzoquinol methylase
MFAMVTNLSGSGVEEERFAFGKNWAQFLRLLSDERIARAEGSLREMLDVQDLRGKSFLDIGSGSGLFSLAARRLGARVHSFDYDPQSVACTAELRRRYFGDDPQWTVEQGSVLDEDYLRRLGKHDVVYSWGVLHHTGDMWRALAMATLPLAPSGKLFIAIYNLQGPVRHRLTLAMKRTYVRGGPLLRPLLLAAYFGAAIVPDLLHKLLLGQSPLAHVRAYAETSRGMSWWRDVVDWVGGYPYEAAGADAIFAFYDRLGFRLEKLAVSGGHGCNEFVFATPAERAAA